MVAMKNDSAEYAVKRFEECFKHARHLVYYGMENGIESYTFSDIVAVACSLYNHYAVEFVEGMEEGYFDAWDDHSGTAGKITPAAFTNESD